jgi:uncharacterized coiled-coil protein SlyX
VNVVEPSPEERIKQLNERVTRQDNLIKALDVAYHALDGDGSTAYLSDMTQWDAAKMICDALHKEGLL